MTHFDMLEHWQQPSSASVGAVVSLLSSVVPGSVFTFTVVWLEIEAMAPLGEKRNRFLEGVALAFAAINFRSLRTVELGFLTGFLSSCWLFVVSGNVAGPGGGSVVLSDGLASFGGLVFGEECFFCPLLIPRGRWGVVGRGRLFFRFFFLSVTSSQGSSGGASAGLKDGQGTKQLLVGRRKCWKW